MFKYSIERQFVGLESNNWLTLLPFFISKFLNVYTEGVIPARDAGSWISVSVHWDEKKKGYLNDILEFTL
ncbi:hypothetical protein [Wolbachia endosymbiont of Trichogramma kaykai]|uniref:hypothetical protein n=1 Tax=Wolbachia endosymbiont of Trichogramma kaykai TaxID=444066 RepID=UPI003891BA4C